MSEIVVFLPLLEPGALLVIAVDNLCTLCHPTMENPRYDHFSLLFVLSGIMLQYIYPRALPWMLLFSKDQTALRAMGISDEP